MLDRKGKDLVETIEVGAAMQAIVRDPLVYEGNNIDPEKMVMWHESDLLDAKIYFTNLWGQGKTINSFDVEMYVRLKDDASIIEASEEVLSNPELEDEALLP